MRGVKPYMNATGKVFTIYECTKSSSSSDMDFDVETIMGAALLGVYDKRISELDKILHELTRNSEKVSTRARTNITQITPRERDDKKDEIPKPTRDKDDRLIYTYRPFKELSILNNRVKSDRSRSHIKK